MKFLKPYTLAELFPQAACEQDISLAGIASPDKCCQEHLVVFFKKPTDEQMRNALTAAAWIIPHGTQLLDPHPPSYFVEKPRYELLKILRRYLSLSDSSERGEIDLTAIISVDASIGHGVAIGPYALIEEGAVIGSNCTIGAHCVVGKRCVLGEDVVLDPHTHLYQDVSIGTGTRIYSHTVVGMPGFGFEFEQGRWEPIPHCGGVQIGQRCRIGSHVSIAAGVIEPTIIGDDVILDNHIHLAHQTHIKQGNALAACVGIAGSTTIEPYCQIGGGVMIAGHLTIGPQVQITGSSIVHKSLTVPGRYSSGWPVEDNASWRRKVAALNRLPEYLKKARSAEVCDE